jgi:hypothetical protein
MHHPHEDPANSYDLYVAARRAEALILEEARPRLFGVVDDGVNPSRNQTTTAETRLHGEDRFRRELSAGVLTILHSADTINH